MHNSPIAKRRWPRGALHLLGASGACFLIALGACGGRDETRSPASEVAGASAAGRSSASAVAGGGQAPRNEAGTASVAQAGMSGAGDDAGAGGTATQALSCEPGGALAVGNYADKAGNELWLRKTATASTLALVPGGVVQASNPPQLFRVERVCSSGVELIAQDASSSYRVDFLQTAGELSLCFSAATASVDAAIASAGCLDKPFTVFSKEAK